MLRGRRVLVVEDNPVAALELASLLEDQGAIVIGPARSVREALQAMAGLGSPIHGAILDIDLGEEMSFAVADALALRNVPFAFLTASMTDSVPASHQHVPIYVKPIDMRRLAGAMRSEVLRLKGWQ